MDVPPGQSVSEILEDLDDSLSVHVWALKVAAGDRPETVPFEELAASLGL